MTPNFEFVPSQIAVAELNAFIAAKLAGFPIAWSSIYDFARRGGLTEFDVEQELAKIQEEGDTWSRRPRVLRMMMTTCLPNNPAPWRPPTNASLTV